MVLDLAFSSATSLSKLEIDPSILAIVVYKLFKRFSMISSLVSLSKTSSSFFRSSAAIERACGTSSSCSSEYSAVN